MAWHGMAVEAARSRPASVQLYVQLTIVASAAAAQHTGVGLTHRSRDSIITPAYRSSSAAQRAAA
jgi:hypothetical protein